MSKKTVVITGASTGIGKGLAQRFANDGHNVAILARRQSLLKELADSLSHSDGTILPIQCDVGDKTQVESAITQCETELGPIDILIANAGISQSSPATEISAKIFEKTFQINVMGAVYCFEAVIPKMMARKSGHLVSISSLASYRGLPGAGAYCASKAALSALTESMRLDLKKSGITVSLINPGYIRTPLTDRNLYKMPFLMSTGAGVDRIYRSVCTRRAVDAFPWPLAMGVRLLRVVPVWVMDWALANRRNLKKPD